MDKRDMNERELLALIDDKLINIEKEIRNIYRFMQTILVLYIILQVVVFFLRLL